MLTSRENPSLFYETAGKKREIDPYKNRKVIVHYEINRNSAKFVVRDEGKSQRTVKALTWRIALSLGLFLFLLIAFALGWISPHGI